MRAEISIEIMNDMVKMNTGELITVSPSRKFVGA